MRELQRFTTEYIDIEDRIRLTGEIKRDDGQSERAVIWLTQRLVNRLIPPLLGILEKQTPSLIAAPTAEPVMAEQRMEIQRFAQQAARADLVQQPPVVATNDAPAWVAQSIDISPGPQIIRLTFRHGDGGEAMLPFNHLLLRQWLNILLIAYRKGEWPLTIWPDWIKESELATPPVREMIH
jgi:hypothetical protein